MEKNGKLVANFSATIDEDNWLVLEQAEYCFETFLFEPLAGNDGEKLGLGTWSTDTATHFPPGTWTFAMLEGPKKGERLEMCWDGIYFTCLTDGWRISFGPNGKPERLEDVIGEAH